MITLPNNQQVNITVDRFEGNKITLKKEVIIESETIEEDL